MDRRRVLAVVAGALGAGTAVAGAATVATIARASADAGANPQLLALEARIEQAHARFEVCFDETDRCQTTVYAWRKENPGPKMRECWVGTNAEYATWWEAHQEAEDPESVAHLDPNRDLKAAMAEHTEQRQLWQARERQVELAAGLAGAEERQEIAQDEYLNLRGELGEIPSRSLADLICKARCVKRDEELATIIVYDLLAMQDAGVNVA
jgi:hypothetical protein